MGHQNDGCFAEMAYICTKQALKIAASGIYLRALMSF